MLKQAPQYTLRMQFADRDTLFVLPDALSANTTMLAARGSTKDITKASSFTTPQAAVEFGQDLRKKFAHYFHGSAKLTVVKVEKVHETKIEAFKYTLGDTLKAGEFLVVTRAYEPKQGWNTSGRRYGPLSEATRFGSIAEAVVALKNRCVSARSNIDGDGFAAYRETSEWTFKFTDLQDVQDADNYSLQYDVTGSSIIAKIEYAPDSKKLRLTLKRAAKAFGVYGERVQPDAVYVYNDVDALDVLGFVGSKSKGSYYGSVFKPKYDKKAKHIKVAGYDF